MDKIQQIQEAIINGAELKSKLSESALQIGGFTSPKIRHTLNNLGAISEVYFEVGVHLGATFISTTYDNKLYSIGCDNFSEFNEMGRNVEKQFEQNCKEFLDEWQYTFENQDCFTITDMPTFDLYMYDGNHSYESQKKAFTHFKRFMRNECIVVVDDFSWHDVESGTQVGIKECDFDILFEQHLKGENGYHNGLYIALLRK